METGKRGNEEAKKKGVLFSNQSLELRCNEANPSPSTCNRNLQQCHSNVPFFEFRYNLAKTVSHYFPRTNQFGTSDINYTCRFEEPNVWFVSDCGKMLYTCEITTYDARRAPSEAQ